MFFHLVLFTLSGCFCFLLRGSERPADNDQFSNKTVAAVISQVHGVTPLFLMD